MRAVFGLQLTISSLSCPNEFVFGLQLVIFSLSCICGVAILAVSKDGAEMTEETIKGMLNGEIPIVNQILIGETINLN
jgi:hypothetical protein